jgi:hypothetical protein
MKAKTRVIAGHKVTLFEGGHYLAHRPIVNKKRKVYPVTISPHPAFDTSGLTEVTIDGLSYSKANEFLTAFNNGPSSFDGRTW